MDDWFVGPVMDRLIDAISDYLKDQSRWQTGMKEELERLRENHPKIKAVVSQAPISDQKSALNEWIWQLRDAIDEAEDLLDEFEYMKLEEQVTTQNMEETKKRSATTSFLFETARKIRKVGERVLRVDPNLKKLQEVVQKLDKVSAEVGTFCHLVENAKQEQQKQELELYKTRETGSLTKNVLVGSGKDKDYVMQWLRKPLTEDPTHTTLYNNISLLSVVGHGGMGKTTLLQHVYEEIKEEFDLKMWVCVSNDFDVKKVIAHMLEHFEKERPILESLAVLQEKLRSRAQCKRFFLVLDDIWEDEERDKNKWENVLAPLASGSMGSKILVSTRMDSVASLMAKVIGKKKETLKLKGLDEGECLQLLNTHAFADVDNVDDHIQLRSIARKIVKKISASPLAAKVIGGVLNSNLSVRHWKSVLNSGIGNTDLSQNNIIPILRLSYTFLPKPLQNCFAFCGIFPQDYEFDRDDLVRMWISLGFIQPPKSEETMEDIGGKYFDILVRKSFFDHSLYKDYKMHDLLHELAQSVSAQECFRFKEGEGLTSRIPKTIRHLYVATFNLEVLGKIRELKILHSLFLKCYRGDQDFIDILDEIFKASRSIRCLVIDIPSVIKIPEAIKNLIHLRYVNLLYTRVNNRLPRSLSSLYHLQFIILPGGFGTMLDAFIPRDINNLLSLRYMGGRNGVFSLIHGIGKLIYLQSLPEFYVKNENGYRIGELEQMNELRNLEIKFLENVRDAEEACSAKLCKKRNLRHLHLYWGGSTERGRDLQNNIVDPVLDAKVLENLQPHSELENLFISAYMGAKSAKWMENPDWIYNLKCIELHQCLEWETLPPFEQLPFLESLILENMPKVKQLCNKFHGNDKVCVFPSLQELRIVNLEALEHWFDASRAVGDIWSFPCLALLWLENCPNLQDLSSLPPKLVQLRIDNIGCKALNNIPTSLKILHVQRLKSLCEITLLKSLSDLPPSLYMLHLSDLHQLDCLPSSLPSLSSLRQLNIWKVPKLQELPDLPSSLDHLDLKDLDQLDCLPSSLPSHSSLRMLHISQVSKLRKLPDLPPSLLKLKLDDLDQLDCLPSSLPSHSSLRMLDISQVSKLRKLPDLPPSLYNLDLKDLEQLDCLPSSLPSLSSLRKLNISKVPKLRELPDLPSSLNVLFLRDLDQLDCLPSSLLSHSSLCMFDISRVSKLRKLPDLPPSLECLIIIECHPELMERYKKSSGSDWHKIADIPDVWGL